MNNVEISYEKNTSEYIREIKKLIKQMDNSFIPYNITGVDLNGDKTVLLKIHYGDQKIIKTISLLPY